MFRSLLAWGIIGPEGLFADILFQVDLLRESDAHPNVIRYFCTVSVYIEPCCLSDWLLLARENIKTMQQPIAYFSRISLE